MKRQVMFLSLAVVSLCSACITNKQDIKEIQLLNKPPLSESNYDGFWAAIDVSETDLNEMALKKHIALCERTGADSQLVVYKNKIVSEWYSDRYEEPIGAMSSTKAIASILIGQLVDDGLLDYSSKVASILPEWQGGYRDNVEIVDLLTHTAGFDRRYGKNDSIGYVGNKREFVLSLYPDFEPKTAFRYSNEAVQLLEPIILEVSGKNAQDFALERLFSVLGMRDTRFYDYGDSPWLYAEMLTTPRDLARIGLLMKNKGIWNDEQIVSSDYVRRATSSSPLNKEMGFLWWILDGKKTVSGFYASGYLNTDMYVFADYDIIVVRTQSPQNGYSGSNESGNYFREAQKLFMQFVNK